MTTNNKPVKKLDSRGLSVAVWENRTDTEMGLRVSHRVTIQKRYQDADGNWQTASAYTISDLGRLLLMLADAYRFIAYRPAKIRGAAVEEEAEAPIPTTQSDGDADGQ